MHWIPLGVCLAFTSGCTFTLVGAAPKSEHAVAQEKTINATFAKSEQFVNACEAEQEDLAAVRYHTNAGYLVVSLLSLGLYVPQHVTWWCGVQEPACEEGASSEECRPYVREDD